MNRNQIVLLAAAVAGAAFVSTAADAHQFYGRPHFYREHINVIRYEPRFIRTFPIVERVGVRPWHGCGGPSGNEVRKVYPDGSTRTVDSTASRISPGEYSCTRTVTERNGSVHASTRIVDRGW